MKTLLLSISLTFSLLASAQVPQFAVNCADDRDGTNSKDIQDVDDNKWNYSNKKDQGPYKDGVPFTGKLIQCGKKNGKVMSKTEYSKGSKHGLAYKYHKDGWLLWKKRYSNGKEDGVQKYFHPSLNMANDGKNVTNTLRTRLSYEAENGKKEGIVRAWYSNGNKEYVERYTNGVKDGEQLYYDENQKVIREEEWENGEIVEQKVFQVGVLVDGFTRIGTIFVGLKDLGRMEWNDAMAACEALGDGWRLPDKDELNLLYQNKEAIGGFANSSYWSSTEDGSAHARGQNFDDGGQISGNKTNTYSVRAVRAI